jgi:hypothetical protein
MFYHISFPKRRMNEWHIHPLEEESVAFIMLLDEACACAIVGKKRVKKKKGLLFISQIANSWLMLFSSPPPVLWWPT